MSTVAFRCNTGVSVGIGHLMRCRAMAAHLAGLGWDSVIMGPPDALQESTDEALFKAWLPADNEMERSADARAFVSFCAKHGATHAVMDDYRGTPGYQHILRDAGLRWLQQFDASAPFDFYADVLVNSGAHAQLALYADHIKNPGCIPLFGPRFAVVRDEFLQTKAQAGDKVRKVLLAFGGGDDRGAIAMAVDALGGLPCSVISGRANPANDALADRFHNGSNVTLHIAPTNIAELMSQCDLAIIAGGTMSYEAAAMGLPFATMALAPNQQGPCQGWEDTIGAPYLGQLSQLSSDAIVPVLSKLIRDAPLRAHLAARGRDAVDGQGVSRLVDALIKGKS